MSLVALRLVAPLDHLLTMSRSHRVKNLVEVPPVGLNHPATLHLVYLQVKIPLSRRA